MRNFDENQGHIIRNVIMPHYNISPSKCWEIEFYKSNGKKNAKWILKTSDSSVVYPVKISTICDVKEPAQWKKFTSFEFAIELLSSFKKGPEFFNRWINEQKH